MFTTVDDFAKSWQNESGKTLKLLQTLTDASLSQAVASNHRTLGRIAWHITTTIPEMMGQAGVKLTKVQGGDPMPPSADMIRKLYDLASKELLSKIKSDWNDGLLHNEDNMYGMQWKRGLTLMILINHEAHHRGQMTVLMRQAGLPVTGAYGPSFEEWGGMGMKPPVI
ncbi:MAG: DinB family protein [candidate division Zixibacteria bacterium]|nr:DinB family protein [candidate division Zixibacteria bacterium]